MHRTPLSQTVMSRCTVGYVWGAGRPPARGATHTATWHQVHDFIEEALPANSGVDDKGLEELVNSFVAQGMAAQIAAEGVASQTSMSLDAFFAACSTSQVREPAGPPSSSQCMPRKATSYHCLANHLDLTLIGSECTAPIRTDNNTIQAFQLVGF